MALQQQPRRLDDGALGARSFDGTGVHGSARDLLDDVPGPPGGAALTSGVHALSGVAGGVTRALGRFRRS